jgi:predicted O-linked N-acetylglucosamine transferase (SPINDLY family)
MGGATWRDSTMRSWSRRSGPDQVDIVLELSGHTHGNKLSALRLRGAPVQATYLGYPNTTGVPAMDYRIVDSLTDPPPPHGAEKWATEKLIRLDPCFLCYTPREDAPLPGPPPVERNGYVTFGSFNSIKKLTEKTLGLWCRLMEAVPDSRLVIKSSGLSSAAAQEHISGVLREGGLDEDRFELLDKMESKADHLAAYEMMDVALDTYPYHGTTTTCEALWQGVPVVSLVGDVHAARVGLSLLSAIGHPEWAVKSEEEYIAVAAGLGRDSAKLARIRGGLRQEMARSPLCDAAAMGKRMEAALRGAWRAWCNG